MSLGKGNRRFELTSSVCVSHTPDGISRLSARTCSFSLLRSIRFSRYPLAARGLSDRPARQGDIVPENRPRGAGNLSFTFCTQMEGTRARPVPGHAGSRGARPPRQASRGLQHLPCIRSYIYRVFIYIVMAGGRVNRAPTRDGLACLYICIRRGPGSGRCAWPPTGTAPLFPAMGPIRLPRLAGSAASAPRPARTAPFRIPYGRPMARQQGGQAKRAFRFLTVEP